MNIGIAGEMEVGPSSSRLLQQPDKYFGRVKKREVRKLRDLQRINYAGQTINRVLCYTDRQLVLNPI